MISKKNGLKRKSDLPLEEVEISKTPKKIKSTKVQNGVETPEEIPKEPLPNRLKDFIKNKKTRILLKKRGIKYLFPIQEKTYFSVLQGKDLIARDRTGSGKTLSYALPLTENLRENGFFSLKKPQQNPYLLILLPTRELAIQVANELKLLKHDNSEFRLLNLYGGTEIRPQIMDLRRGAEVVVGTPGRILDLLERNCLNFSEVKTIVLDEADTMLNLGFQESVEQICEKLKEHKKGVKTQFMLFSATIPAWVHSITKKYIDENREFIDLIKNSEVRTAKTVEHLAINCPYHMRVETIADVVLCYGGRHCRTLIFTETKSEANDILLKSKMKQECQVLHGDIPQKQREITFQGFREGKFKCLIATNVASRGLDIPEIDLIVQLDPPTDVDSYIHRAGRTARAGRKGVCVTFYTKKQLFALERIERKANIILKRVGTPQPCDIIKASVRDITNGLKQVSDEVLPLFETAADELIKELGAEGSLARALAYISGHTEKLKQRSLLCAFEGWVTFIIKSQMEFRNIGFVWTFIRNNIDFETVNKIKGMRAFKDMTGAAFDVPEECQKFFEEFQIQNHNFTIEKALILPDLIDENPTFNSNNNGSDVRNGRNNGFNGNNSNFGRNNGNNGNNNNFSFKGKKELEVFIGNLGYNANYEDVTEFFKQNGVFFVNLSLLFSGKN